MDWRLHRGARLSHSAGLATLARATGRSGRSALCAFSSVKRAAQVNTDTCHSSCLAPRCCSEAGSCRGRVSRRTAAAAAASGGSIGARDAAAVTSDPLFCSASDTSSGPRFAPSEGCLAAVFEACHGPITPEQQQLLELEAQIAAGVLYCATWKDKPIYVTECFCIVAQFDPRSLSPRPDIVHAANAAKHKLLHSLATEAMTLVPEMKDLDPLMAILSACATSGYGWGSMGAASDEGKRKGRGKGTGGKGRGAGVQVEAEAEGGAGVQAGPAAGGQAQAMIQVEAEAVPLAEAILKQMNTLADTPSQMRKATQAPGGSVDAGMHARLWELVAACPEFAEPLCRPLLNASAEVLQTTRQDKLIGGTWPYRVLMALSHLQHVRNEQKLLVDWLGSCGQDAGTMENWELCETVAALGDLLLVQVAQVRSCTDTRKCTALSHVALPVAETVQHLRRRLQPQHAEATDKARRGGKKQQRSGLGQQVAKLLTAQKRAKRGKQKEAKSFDGREACQLVQGLAMISEAFWNYADIVKNAGGDSADGLLQNEDAQLIAVHATTAAELAVSHISDGGLMKLTPRELSGAVLALARTGHGTNDSYRALGAAASSARGSFRSAATLAHWAQLWHALALVRHRPDDALVRCTAAALTKQQQYGCATAEDCATLLLSLAELRCYDGGLVEVLLGWLVQLVEGGGGVEVTHLHLTNAVWAVAVMGPEALRSHCGAVGPLLREVVAVWEQGRVGVGEQEQLRQLWQVQLELEGLVDGGAGSSGDSSSSSPGQLRHVLPPDLLRAAEEAAGENPGGVYSSSRRLQRLRDEVCSVLQGIVQQGGGQQDGQGVQGQQRAGRKKKAPGSRAGIRMAAEGDSAAADTAAGPVPFCTILSVTPQAAVPELRCTADVVVELGGGRRVAVEVEGPGRLLTNHPHTETRTGRAELRRRQLERVLGSGNVLGVSYWAWEELGGNRGRQEAWLWGRLADGPGAGGEGDDEVNSPERQKRAPWKQKAEGQQQGAEEQQGPQTPTGKNGGEQQAAKRRGRPRKAAT